VRKLPHGFVDAKRAGFTLVDVFNTPPARLQTLTAVVKSTQDSEGLDARDQVSRKVALGAASALFRD
jgi:hypothetical protein